MGSKTRIVILRIKKVAYTTTFIGLTVLLVSLFLVMFRPKKDAMPGSADASAYVSGAHMVSLVLGSQDVNMEVTVDVDHISSVALSPLSDSATAMYPLMRPVFEDLAKQVCAARPTENLSYSMEARYASAALTNTIEQAPHKTEIRDAQQKIRLSISASQIILYLAAGCDIVLMEL